MSARSILRARDALWLGSVGLRSRPLRVILSAAGIAIGIAAMIAVVGVSSSGQAQLNAEFARLGTNLLSIKASDGLDGTPGILPNDSVARLERVEGVEHVSSISVMNGVAIYRNEHIDQANTSGLGLASTDEGLPRAVSATLASGTWLNGATAQFPTVVLGSAAADRLGIIEAGAQILVGPQYHVVVGILDPVTLVPELDTFVFMGHGNAEAVFNHEGVPSTVFERSADEDVLRLRGLLPSAVNAESPETVSVSRPSDVLAAKHATDQTFTGVLVGLGAVALLVGGIGVANTMIISVLERRREIGLRRALGATRRHIRLQFLTEALMLSLLGGVVGAALGVAVTAVFAAVNGWPLSVPPAAIGIGIAATLLIGAIAGIYPAVRASRLQPTESLSAQ